MMMGSGNLVFGWIFGALMVATATGLAMHRWQRQPTGIQRRSGDPLAAAREKYVHGEISQEEFERIIEQLLRTEPLP